MVPAESLRKKQLGILWEITILLVVVFLVYGLLTYAVFTASGNRLIDKSIEKLKQTEAENISSSYTYVMNLLTPTLEAKAIDKDPQEIMAAVMSKQTSDIQTNISGDLATMVDSGMLGMSKNLFIFEKWPVSDEPFVFASSDLSLVSAWDVPGYLSQAIDEGISYIWMEDGIPELGLEDEQLIVVIRKNFAQYNLLTGFVGIKPMHDNVAAIEDFYQSDRRNTNLIMLTMVLGGILIIALITFFILSYLIRTRITEPIQELSSAAEQVMEGDLDIHITIRSGEEFEQLKRAFQSMVDEWGRLMARSIEGGEN